MKKRKDQDNDDKDDQKRLSHEVQSQMHLANLNTTLGGGNSSLGEPLLPRTVTTPSTDRNPNQQNRVQTQGSNKEASSSGGSRLPLMKVNTVAVVSGKSSRVPLHTQQPRLAKDNIDPMLLMSSTSEGQGVAVVRHLNRTMDQKHMPSAQGNQLSIMQSHDECSQNQRSQARGDDDEEVKNSRIHVDSGSDEDQVQMTATKKKIVRSQQPICEEFKDTNDYSIENDAKINELFIPDNSQELQNPLREPPKLMVNSVEVELSNENSALIENRRNPALSSSLQIHDFNIDSHSQSQHDEGHIKGDAQQQTHESREMAVLEQISAAEIALVNQDDSESQVYKALLQSDLQSDQNNKSKNDQDNFISAERKQTLSSNNIQLQGSFGHSIEDQTALQQQILIRASNEFKDKIMKIDIPNIQKMLKQSMEEVRMSQLLQKQSKTATNQTPSPRNKDECFRQSLDKSNHDLIKSSINKQQMQQNHDNSVIEESKAENGSSSVQQFAVEEEQDHQSYSALNNSNFEIYEEKEESLCYEPQQSPPSQKSEGSNIQQIQCEEIEKEKKDEPQQLRSSQQINFGVHQSVEVIHFAPRESQEYQHQSFIVNSDTDDLAQNNEEQIFSVIKQNDNQSQQINAKQNLKSQEVFCLSQESPLKQQIRKQKQAAMSLSNAKLNEAKQELSKSSQDPLTSVKLSFSQDKITSSSNNSQQKQQEQQKVQSKLDLENEQIDNIDMEDITEQFPAKQKSEIILKPEQLQTVTPAAIQQEHKHISAVEIDNENRESQISDSINLNDASVSFSKSTSKDRITLTENKSPKIQQEFEGANTYYSFNKVKDYGASKIVPKAKESNHHQNGEEVELSREDSHDKSPTMIQQLGQKSLQQSNTNLRSQQAILSMCFEEGESIEQSVEDSQQFQGLGMDYTKDQKQLFKNVFGQNKAAPAQRYGRQETGSFGGNMDPFRGSMSKGDQEFMKIVEESFPSSKNSQIELAQINPITLANTNTNDRLRKQPLIGQTQLNKNLQKQPSEKLQIREERQSISGYIHNIGMPPKTEENQLVDHEKNKDGFSIKLPLLPTQDEKIDYSELVNEYNLNLHTIKTRKLKHKRCQPIEPDSNFKTSWDILGLFLILYCAVVIPYRVAFNMQSNGMFMFFEYSIDIFFMIDVLINLYTGYYKKGALIMKRRHIMCRYLKTWFIIDFLSAVPYAWFIDEVSMTEEELEIHKHEALAHHTSQLLRLLKIVRFMRIIRLIRLFKLRRLVNRFEEVFFNDTVSTGMALLKVFIVIFYIVHWAACLFFYIGDIERYQGNNNWISNFGIDQLPKIDQYVAAAHWALTTMTTVGYGDLYPISPTEQVYGLFCMIMACGVFAYIIGSLSTIIDHKSALIVEFKEKIMQVNDFMIHHKISTDFRIKVRRYLDYVYDNKKQYKLEEEDVLSMLNDNLKVETTIHLNGKLLNETPIFKSFEVAFLSQLTFVIKKKVFIIDEHIFEEGDIGDSLLYIQKGNVVLIHKKTSTFIKELGSDDFMGECAFFTNKPRKVSARSKNFTDVITLSKHDFLMTAEDFPKARDNFFEIQQHISTTKDFSKIGVKCYVCEEIGHISIDCPQFGTVEGNEFRMFGFLKDKIIEKGNLNKGQAKTALQKQLPVQQKLFKEDEEFKATPLEQLQASLSHFKGLNSKESPHARDLTGTFNRQNSSAGRLRQSKLAASTLFQAIEEEKHSKPWGTAIKAQDQEESSGSHQDNEDEAYAPLMRKQQSLIQQNFCHNPHQIETLETQNFKNPNVLNPYKPIHNLKGGVQTWNGHLLRPVDQQEIFEMIKQNRDRKRQSGRMSQISLLENDELSKKSGDAISQNSQNIRTVPHEHNHQNKYFMGEQAQKQSKVENESAFERKEDRQYALMKSKGSHAIIQDSFLLGRRQTLNPHSSIMSKMTAGYVLGDTLAFKKENEKKDAPPVDIGKVILEDIGKNFIRRDGGGEFMDMITNTEQLKEPKQNEKTTRYGTSTLRSIKHLKEAPGLISHASVSSRSPSHIQKQKAYRPSTPVHLDQEMISQHHKDFKEDMQKMSLHIRKNSLFTPNQVPSDVAPFDKAPNIRQQSELHQSKSGGLLIRPETPNIPKPKSNKQHHISPAPHQRTTFQEDFTQNFGQQREESKRIEKQVNKPAKEKVKWKELSKKYGLNYEKSSSSKSHDEEKQLLKQPLLR